MKDYEINPYGILYPCKIMGNNYKIGSYKCTRDCEHVLNLESHKDANGRVELITFTCKAKEKKLNGEFSLIPHSYQIADTGDYDGYYEISNGDFSIFTNDGEEEAVLEVVNALNNSGCKFYLDDKDAVEVMILKQDKENLKNMLKELKESLRLLSLEDSEAEKIDYEYEMYFDSKPGELIQIQGWVPIDTNSIIKKEQIPHYLEIGLLRKIEK